MMCALVSMFSKMKFVESTLFQIEAVQDSGGMHFLVCKSLCMHIDCMHARFVSMSWWAR